MIVRVSVEDNLIVVKPMKKHGRPYVMGTVMLSNARMVDGFCTGELVHEATEALPPSHPALENRLVTYKPKKHSSKFFSVAYFYGNDFLVFIKG